MTDKEWDLAWLKAATQRWEAKPKPLLEDGTKVWTMSITFPLSLITYSMYAFLSSVSNLCWVSFHTIFGTPAPPLPVPEMVVLAIISVSACVWSFFYGTVNSYYLHMIIAVHTNRILLYKLFFFFLRKWQLYATHVTRLIFFILSPRLISQNFVCQILCQLDIIYYMVYKFIFYA